MPGESGLDRHLCCLQIPDLTHHDDIRVLPHQGSNARGEIELDFMLYLTLIEAVLDHLDGVLNSADVHIFGGESFKGRIKGGGLARARGAGDQHNAMGSTGHGLPAFQVITTEPQISKAAQQHIGIKNSHHQFFAKSGRQGGQTQLDFTTRRRDSLDPAILGTAFFRYVHAAEYFQATGDSGHHLIGQVIDLMQHTIDAKANPALVPPRLQMNITGPLVESILQQPVHNIDNVLILSIGILEGANL